MTAFFIILIVVLAAGWWVRSNEKSLAKEHAFLYRKRKELDSDLRHLRTRLFHQIEAVESIRTRILETDPQTAEELDGVKTMLGELREDTRHLKRSLKEADRSAENLRSMRKLLRSVNGAVKQLRAPSIAIDEKISELEKEFGLD